MKRIKVIIFLVVIFVFIYLRLAPILNQTVPYTYDQGRDFLKAQEIVKTHNLTFIGPTTGIQGVFHGAWWYYFLSIPYFIFSGWPQGFYLFLLLCNSAANILFYLFLNTSFGFIPAIFYLAMASLSPYLRRTSFFASNDMLAPIFVLFFILFLYKLFEKKDNKYLLLTGLALGFILESELAFGIFLIPASLIALFIFKQFGRIKKLLIFFAGLLIPMIPWMLFEVKNHFLQTKALIYNLTTKKDAHPLLFRAVFEERSRVFIQYWQDLFYNNSLFISLIILSLVIYFFIFHQKTLGNSAKKMLFYFLLTVTSLLFIFSLFYQGSFFWGYYFQGVQYFYLMIAVISIYGIVKTKKIALFSYLLVIVLVLLNVFSLVKDIGGRKTIPEIGLKADNKIINYFIDNSQHQYFCLKIYTPPVIPYTYMYLLSYYADQQKIIYPKGDFYNNQCYFVIDEDAYQFRVDKWRQENIPKEAKLKKLIKFENGTKIELWSFDN